MDKFDNSDNELKKVEERPANSPEEQMKNLFSIFEVPSSDENWCRTRSKWESMSMILNLDNNFKSRTAFFGKFPEDVIE